MGVTPADAVHPATAAVEVAVVGSGAAGLIAACRAADAGHSVIVLEKADLLGGTSAVSGGVMWMPNNHLMGAAYPDSDEAALSYLTAATGGRVPEGTLRWYIETAREAVRWLDADTRVRLAALPRPDYHTDWAGAARGRGLDNLPFGGRQFPGLTARIRPPTYFPSITMAERDAMAASGFDAELSARRDADGTRTMGGALIAALVISAEERGVRIVAGTGVDGLRRTDTGWVLTTTAGSVTARSVVLASGGFEWNPRLQEAFLPNPVTPISAPSNTGDGLELGLAAGGPSPPCGRFGVCPCCRTRTTVTTGDRAGGWPMSNSPCRVRSWSTPPAAASSTRRSITTT